MSNSNHNNLKLSIIIVSWNVKELLKKCLRSIYEQTKNISFEIFVVDNNSKDESLEMVAREFPHVKLIRNAKNMGFSAANNQAIKKCTGEYIILLNPDTEILDSALEDMVKFLEENSEIGIVGAKLLNPDRTNQIGLARKFPSFFVLTTMMLGLHKILIKKNKALQNYYMLDENFNRTVEVDQVMGADLMFTREVLETVGLLDAKFWIWFEEVDFCKRAKDAGYKIYIYPKSEIIHHVGKSFIQTPKLTKYFNLSMSLMHYARKHFGFLQYFLLTLLWPLGLLQAMTVHTCLKLYRHDKN